MYRQAERPDRSQRDDHVAFDHGLHLFTAGLVQQRPVRCLTLFGAVSVRVGWASPSKG
jgi:hypothetical protein